MRVVEKMPQNTSLIHPHRHYHEIEKGILPGGMYDGGRNVDAGVLPMEQIGSGIEEGGQLERRETHNWYFELEHRPGSKD
jgi:hypothetical protein